MNIVVIGGAGFIGSVFCRDLALAGHQIISIARAANNSRDSAIKHIDGNYDDLHNLGELYSTVDVIIHSAHDTTPSSSASQSSLEVSANLLPTLRLLEFLEKQSKAHLIYLSSGGSVYGNNSSERLTEESRISPISYYGAGKASIEHFISSYVHQSGNNATILRPTNAYGPGQLGRSNFGLIPSLMSSCLYGSTFTLWGDGNSTRDYIYVDDIARLCLASINAIDSKKLQGLNVFNTAAGVSFSILEIISLIQKITGTKISIETRDARKVDVTAVSVDPSNAHKLLGWQPLTHINEGLEQTWEWFKKQTR